MNRPHWTYVVWCVGGMIVFAVAVKLGLRWVNGTIPEPDRSLLLLGGTFALIALGFLIDWIRKPRRR